MMRSRFSQASSTVPALLVIVATSGGFLAKPAAQASDEPPGKTTSAPAEAKPVGEPGPLTTLRGGPERIGVVNGAHLPERPALEMTVEVEGDVGQPLVSDGVIYFGIRDRGGSVCALKLADGSLAWRNDDVGDVLTAPARRGDRIYVSSEKGLSALTRDGGKLIWTFAIPDGSGESSPLAVKGKVVVAGYDGNVYAVGEDGKAIWKHDIVSDEPPSPPNFDSKKAVLAGKAARPGTAASDGLTVFQPVFNQSRVIAIDLQTGKRRWAFQAKGWIYGEPAVADDRVFLGSQDDHFYCLDKKTGQVLWSFPTKSRIEAGAAYRDGSVYFGACDGRFYRVDARTGKEVWSFQMPSPNGASTAIYSSPLCTEDSVYFGSFDGGLYGLKIDGGGLRWRHEPMKNAAVVSSPVTDGRKIVLSLRKEIEKRGFNGIVIVGEGGE